MTKAELLQALAPLPDDAEILIEAWPDSGNQREDLRRLPVCGELYTATAEVIEGEGGHPAFLNMKPITRERQ
jgi:hypothetical protein